MKTRKALFVLLMVGCLMASFAMEATAATAWYTCTIDKVGPYGLNELTNGCYVYMTYVAGPSPWQDSKKMFISPDRGKEYLAAALAAFTSTGKVEVYINAAATTPTIYGLYLVK